MFKVYNVNVMVIVAINLARTYSSNFNLSFKWQKFRGITVIIFFHDAVH